MTDVADNLGVLMGQSAEEQATEAMWAEIGESVIGSGATESASALSEQPATEGAAAAEPLATTSSDLGLSADPVGAVLPEPTSTEPVEAGFPFETSELISLLPHSVAGRANEIWEFAAGLAATSNTFMIALIVVGCAFLLVTLMSTLRVWRRESEFSVSGFGDGNLRPGLSYTVRQEPMLEGSKGPTLQEQVAKAKADAPVDIAGERKPEAVALSGPTVVRRQLKVKLGALPTAEAAEEMPAEPAPEAEEAEGRPRTVAAIRRARRQAARAAKTADQGEAKQAETAKKEKQEVKAKAPESKPEAKKTKAAGKPALRSTKTSDDLKSKPRARRLFGERKPVSFDAGPAAALKPSNVPLAASFYGSFGSFQPTDQLFAQAYLDQTIRAFEAGFLTKRGPRFGRKLVTKDNTRAERLFMMATQSGSGDPQAALTALWQAVEENPDDAVAWLRLAHFYLEVGDTETAVQILEPLLKRAEQDNLPLVAAAAANSLGRIAVSAGELDSAYGHFTNAMKHAEASGQPYMLGVTASNLGSLEAARGNNEIARDLLLRGVESFEACDEAVASARAKVVLGAVYMALGDAADAHSVWGEARETFLSQGLEEDAAIVANWLAGAEPPTGG